ncbi:hypothetical protein [Alicyclobacillus fodiniaquatilis]|uniref:DUF1722 domain-containing protein n=1 Tax=Alicyclobacillus fodiniaquatilis TaxID=1661150 RepID=A0ABW4JK44_9BACL
MAQEQDVQMLFQACEAFWRDIQYPVMERSHSAEQMLGEHLQAARGDVKALQTWLMDCLEVEKTPVSLAGMRNTLFHVFGDFKEHLSAEDRHTWHTQILTQPQKARQRMYELLAVEPNADLLTSYYWRSDAWRLVWFRYANVWWQFRLSERADGLLYTFLPAKDVLKDAPLPLLSASSSHAWLHQARLGVRLPDGELVVYPGMMETIVHVREQTTCGVD